MYQTLYKTKIRNLGRINLDNFRCLYSINDIINTQRYFQLIQFFLLIGIEIIMQTLDLDDGSKDVLQNVFAHQFAVVLVWIIDNVVNEWM